MKTIVILDNLFGPDMFQSFNYLKDNLNMKKYNLISPMTFMKDPQVMDKFMIKNIASAISLGNMYNEFGTIKAITDQNKTTIYYGLAHNNIKANQIFIVNEVVVDTQENLLDKYLNETGVRFDYIKSSRAEKSFKDIKDLVVFLNDLQ
jgi:hypothetical protein